MYAYPQQAESGDPAGSSTPVQPPASGVPDAFLLSFAQQQARRSIQSVSSSEFSQTEAAMTTAFGDVNVENNGGELLQPTMAPLPIAPLQPTFPVQTAGVAEQSALAQLSILSVQLSQEERLEIGKQYRRLNALRECVVDTVNEVTTVYDEQGDKRDNIMRADDLRDRLTALLDQKGGSTLDVN